MAQVKFIQLGTAAEPKRDYLLEGETLSEYKTALDQAKVNYPGALIFTSFKKSATGKVKNEIYANGLLYSAGGSGSGAVYFGAYPVNASGVILEVLPEGSTDTPKGFSNIAEGAEPEKGNVYIYSPEETHTKEGENVADRTAYYYDGTKWVAFTGNVNAENVWFNENFILAGDYDKVGNVIKSSAKDTFAASGMNLKLVMDAIFTKELEASPVGPTYTFSATVTAPDVVVKNGTTAVSSDSYLEVGTTLTVSTINSVASTCVEKVEITGLSYGYKINLDGSKVDTETYILSGIPSSESNYKLDLAISGYCEEDDKSNTGTNKGTTSIESFNVIVSDGDNTLQLTEQGLKYSRGGLNSESVYKASNLDKWTLVASISTAIEDENITSPVLPSHTSAQHKVIGYYPIYLGASTTKLTSDTCTERVLKRLSHYRQNQEDYTAASGTILILQAVPYSTYDETTHSGTLSAKAIKMANDSSTTAAFCNSNASKLKDIKIFFDGELSRWYAVYALSAMAATGNENKYKLTYNS